MARNPRRQRDAPDQLPFPESRAGSLGYILGVDGANVFAGNGNGSGNYADNDAAEITAYTGPTTAEAHESAMAIEAAAAAAAANGTPYSYWTAGNYDELPLEVRHTGARFPEQPGQSSSPDDERLHREVQAGHRRQERRMAREVERQAAVARGIVKRRRHGGDDGRRR